MQPLPLATVVMVTYNSSRFIKNAIESILCQSNDNFELIICDDASKDDTWPIIQQYKDHRVRAFRNEENIGEYRNRNKALQLSKGEYLIFIDGDDMMYPHGLEFMVKMLHAFPECGMALMQWFRNNIFYPVVISPEMFYEGVYFDYGFNNVAFTNVLFRTSVLKAAGGLSEKYKAGDSYIRLKIAATSPCLLINDDLTWWRETPGQASERLNNSSDGITTEYNIKYEFLNHPACPLSKKDRNKAKKNMDHVLSRYIVRQFFRLEWKNLSVMRSCNFSIPDLRSFFSKPEKRDPFKGFTSTSPFMLDLDKNPYAKK